MTYDKSKQYKDAFFWLLGVFCAVSLTAASWSLNETARLTSRVDVIDDSRFTKEDALRLEIQLRREMVSAVNEIKDCLVALQFQEECQ
jgi:hypothetical protein